MSVWSRRSHDELKMKLSESMFSEFYVTWFRFLDGSWCFAFQLDRHSTIQRCAFKFHLAPRRRRSPRRPVWSPMRSPMRNRFVAVLATLCFFFFASQLFAWISPQRRRRPPSEPPVYCDSRSLRTISIEYEAVCVVVLIICGSKRLV